MNARRRLNATPSCPFSPISFFLSLLLSFCTFWIRFGPHFGDLEVPTNSNLFEKVIKFEVFAVVTDSVLHVLCDIASWGGRRQGRSLQIIISVLMLWFECTEKASKLSEPTAFCSAAYRIARFLCYPALCRPYFFLCTLSESPLFGLLLRESNKQRLE